MATSSEQLRYADLGQFYFNKGFFINFFHIPTAKTVSFKSFITTFSDRFQSEWNDESVYGRSDPISNFKGTKRQINLGFDVIAASLEEAKENMSKISLLINMLYPVYSTTASGASAISTSPLFKIKFSNLIQSVSKTAGGLVSKLDGLSYEPVLETGFFDEPNKLFPILVKLSCVLTVFHTHPLGWGSDKQIRTGKFPYGQTIILPGEIKSPSTVPIGKETISSSRNGTTQQKEAKQNSILNSK